jgi:hypothetical protein
MAADTPATVPPTTTTSTDAATGIWRADSGTATVAANAAHPASASGTSFAANQRVTVRLCSFPNPAEAGAFGRAVIYN